MDKFMAFIAYTFTEMLLSTLVFLLLVHVVVDVAQLFNVTLVTQIPYVELFGLILILRLAMMTTGLKRKDLKEAMLNLDKDKTTSKQSFGYAVMGRVIFTLMILGAWFNAYLIHWIFL